MTTYSFKAKLFGIVDNAFHFVTHDDVKVEIVVEDNMQDLLEAECLKRKKLQSKMEHPIS